MKTIDKYILKETIFLFIFGTLLSVLLFQANLLMFLFKAIHISNVPLLALFQVVLLRTPDFLKLSLIMGLTLAVSLTFARLTRESEIKAMHASGISLPRIILPVAIFGLIISFVSFLLLDKVVPVSQKKFRDLVKQIFIVSAAPDFKADVILDLDKYTATFGSVSRNKTGAILLNQVLLLERHKKNDTWVYSATRGDFDGGIWTLKEPYILNIKNDQLLTAYGKGTLEINERISIEPGMFMHASDDEESLSTIKSKIALAEKKNKPTQSLWISYHSKFSMAFACFVFAIMGCFISIRHTSKGPYAGVLLSLLSILFFYIVTILSDNYFSTHSWMPPIIAAWIPNILLLTYVIYIYRRSS